VVPALLHVAHAVAHVRCDGVVEGGGVVVVVRGRRLPAGGNGRGRRQRVLLLHADHRLGLAAVGIVFQRALVLVLGKEQVGQLAVQAARPLDVHVPPFGHRRAVVVPPLDEYLAGHNLVVQEQ